MSTSGHSRGPLVDGARVAIIGGGPGGVGCALALHNLAQQAGRTFNIRLFEGKVFSGEQHFNQCVGVLSPPIEQILEERLGVAFPRHLVQRKITGYVLHGDHREIILDESDPTAFALRRVQFDEYLLDQARQRGIEIISGRVTDLEFHTDHVVVYSESGVCESNVVVGAFGTDDGTATVFSRATQYRPPNCLNSIVTKFHPRSEEMDRFGNRIHAFLPSESQIEFGAATPKGDHLTVNIAGASVDTTWMIYFLHLPQVRAVLPKLEDAQKEDDLTFFKGRFPMSVAQDFTGHRYVIVGDAAGLVRAFKGKGVNSALLTGQRAAETMLKRGVSAEAWSYYHHACRDITDDLPYGRFMRAFAGFLRRWHLLDSVITVSGKDPSMRRALFDSVSAHRPYRNIVWSVLSPLEFQRTVRFAASLAVRRKLRRAGRN